MKNKYRRPQFDPLLKRIQKPRRFIQILFGPRQVGKTTLIEQVLDEANLPFIFGSADAEARTDGLWVQQQWERARASSPKFQVYNTALISAQRPESFEAIRELPDQWGHVFESAVGAHLANMAFEHSLELTYWRHENLEVDFILSQKNRHVAIEVKSGRKRDALNGMKRFAAQFNPQKSLLVGSHGIPIEEFFELPPSTLLK